MNISTQRVGDQAGRTSYAGAGGSPIATPAQPRPMTRLEAAHEKQFSALCRLRELQGRAQELADRLVGRAANETKQGCVGDGSASESRPLVRAIEETSCYLHDAIKSIDEALGRLESL